MSAVQVTSSNSNSFQNAARTVFRDSNGTPYVLVKESASTFSVQRLGALLGSLNNIAVPLYMYDGGYEGLAQSFEGNGGKVFQVDFLKQSKVGSPTGTLTAYIYAHQGTYGTSSRPYSSPIATSTNSYDVSSLTTGSETLTFNFDGVAVEDGTYYCMAVWFNETYSSESDYVTSGRGSVGAGNGSYLQDGLWYSLANNWDVAMRVLIAGGHSDYEDISAFVSDSDTSGTAIEAVSGAIDGSDVLHICWEDDIGKASTLKYATCDLTALSLSISSPTTIVSDLGEDPTTGTLYTAIAIDANDVPHIVYTEYPKIGGASTYTAMYVNKVGGSWNTAVQVEYTQYVDCEWMDIVVGLDNIPIILTGSTEYLYGTLVYLGNTNNATSFTNQTWDETYSTADQCLVVAPNGDVYVIWVQASDNSSIEVRKHVYGNSWATWSDITHIDTNIDECPSVSAAWAGDTLYIFYENLDDSDIYYITYDGSWSDVSVLETGTYNSVRAKWGFWVDNDSQGALVTHQEEAANVATVSVSLYSGSTTAVGHSFTADVTAEIKLATFKLSKVATPTGNAYAKLYAHSGTYGTSSVPTGSALATSDAFDVSTLTNIPTDYTFTFSTSYELQASTNYVIVLEFSGGDAVNTVNVRYFNSTGHDGNYSSYNGSWTATSSYDLYFNVLLYSHNTPTELDYAFVDETATPDIWWNTFSLAGTTTTTTEVFYTTTTTTTAIATTTSTTTEVAHTTTTTTALGTTTTTTYDPWVTYPLKWHNGSTWVEKPLKYYTGGSWQTFPIKKYTP